jgi:nitrite reductase (NADH) small subunit
MTAYPWVRLLALAECPPEGKSRFVACNGHELAVFHLAEPRRFVVTPNGCPHAGGNLAAGHIEDHQVCCPWHEWTFDLDTGSCRLSPEVSLTRYESRQTEDFLWVRLPD